MSLPAMTCGMLRTDCRWFRGDLPCRPHKQHGVHCTDDRGEPCAHFEPQSGRILIIKLGAIGDVIRTTPLLHRLRKLYPRSAIWWLTLTPEVVPAVVDLVLPFTPASLLTLQATSFDFVFNFDKDREACALTAALQASVKKGFTLREGKPAPIDADAEHKYLTGLFDDLNRANTRSYPEELFDICGFRFEGERYILDVPPAEGRPWRIPRGKGVVGLNTGCGGRWISRLWPETSWVRLARMLKKAGYVPLLLGGEQEHARNRRIAARSGARYPGHFPLRRFITLVNQCDLVVTAVTMAMHITIGLGKKIVLFNNIFNRHEFELYGLGTILEPDPPCTCFYAPVCPQECMRRITADRVYAACRQVLHG